LDLKEARNKFGQVDSPKSFSSASKNRRKFLDTKYNSCLSFLHDSQHNALWARKIRALINNPEELKDF